MSDPLHDPYSPPQASPQAHPLPPVAPKRKVPAWRRTPRALVSNIWAGAMLLVLVTCATVAIGPGTAGFGEGALVILAIGWIAFPLVCLRGLIPLFRAAHAAERAGMVASVIFAPIAASFIVSLIMVFVLRIGIC